MVAMSSTQTMLLTLHAAHIRHKVDDAGILLHEVMEMNNLPLKLVQMHYPSQHISVSQKSAIQHTAL